jgi:hypothetical protein
MSEVEMTEFSKAQLSATTGLVEFVADRVGEPAWELAIRDGLDSLAREAQRRWPAAQAGEVVDLKAEHLNGAFDGLANSDEVTTFIEHAGYILLNGQDAPLATVTAIRNTIDFLSTRNKGE